MKIALILSIVTNVVLGWLLFTSKPAEKEIVERVIIETHAEKKNPPAAKPQMLSQSETPAEKTTSEQKENEPPTLMLNPMDDHDVQNAGEKMEFDRQEFMTRELGMSEEKISAHNRLRDAYYKEMAQYWEKNPMRELSFEERRKMLDMEEELHSKLEKLHGKENWKKYQQYRENYNQRGFKKQIEDNQPFLFMGL